jgi:hypothetical protein
MKKRGLKAEQSRLQTEMERLQRAPELWVASYACLLLSDHYRAGERTGSFLFMHLPAELQHYILEILLIVDITIRISPRRGRWSYGLIHCRLPLPGILRVSRDARDIYFGRNKFEFQAFNFTDTVLPGTSNLRHVTLRITENEEASAQFFLQLQKCAKLDSLHIIVMESLNTFYTRTRRSSSKIETFPLHFLRKLTIEFYNLWWVPEDTHRRIESHLIYLLQ